MKLRDLLYFSALIIPLIALLGVYFPEQFSYLTPFVIFIIIPLLEGITTTDPDNYTEKEELSRLQLKVFDWVLYLNVPLVYVTIYLYGSRLQSLDGLSYISIVGLIISLGIVLGSNGINVAHELGHRYTRIEKLLSYLLLLPSHYLHFRIEHNYGHHKYVATPADPATARKGEHLYAFWWRSVSGSYLNAWKIEEKRLKGEGAAFLSFRNKMILYTIVQILFQIAVFMVFGAFAWSILFVSGIVGFLLLETINYIEHYGLLRKKVTDTIYEPVKPNHSWNSDHRFGRILLFELTRHSDHHYKANRKYQILRHMDISPQLPLGYPGSMLLALLPPLWFRKIDPLLEGLNNS